MTLFAVNGTKRLVTYKEWSNLIQASFESYYYVPLGNSVHSQLKSTELIGPTDPTDDAKYNVNPPIVNRRGIYKDIYGSGPGREWSDYQLRCNFPVAMVVAPELFDPEHACGALRIADQHLRGPLGMKTLDPHDYQYRGDYDNSNDSDDGSIAKGLNYHNVNLASCISINTDTFIGPRMGLAAWIFPSCVSPLRTASRLRTFNFPIRVLGLTYS